MRYSINFRELKTILNVIQEAYENEIKRHSNWKKIIRY